MVPVGGSLWVPIIRHRGSPGRHRVFEGEDEIPVTPAPPEKLLGSREFVINFQSITVWVGKIHAPLVGMLNQSVHRHPVGLEMIIGLLETIMRTYLDGDVSYTPGGLPTLRRFAQEVMPEFVTASQTI